IVRYGSDHERSHVDIISATMNLAGKMQSVTKGSQMVIGDALYEKLSDDLQQFFEKANLGQIKWNYHNLAQQNPYQLYIVNF
ncbi:MAG: adenylate/guanylate cyclase domain-containing protein, partial [Thermoproteota archaeon]|nr:adenylate/guanylate cyclase domain-containing protein [Thermoproteota archaeon]